MGGVAEAQSGDEGRHAVNRARRQDRLHAATSRYQWDISAIGTAEPLPDREPSKLVLRSQY
jgi:hypothetical protein